MTDFTPESWRDRLDRHGETIRWLRRMRCPCVAPATKSASRTCTKCGGKGFAYSEQTVSQFRALLTEQVPRKVFTNLGQFQLGDLVCQTMPDEIPIGEHDIVIAITRLEEGDTVLVRGTNDTLPAHPVTELVAVEDIAANYTPEVDCTLANSQVVTWLTAGPATGTNYSVRYRYQPTYDVIEMLPHRRREVDGVRLPQAVTLRQRTLGRGQEAWQ